MNEFISAGVALLLALGFWGAGRRPKALFESKSPKNVSSTSYYSLVVKSEDSLNKNSDFNSPKLISSKPRTAKEKLELLNKLKKFISSVPEDRLFAIKTAREWGDPAIIPILNKGLRDFDSRVVISAAEGISKFRNQPKTIKVKSKRSHPLNVFLMR